MNTVNCSCGCQKPCGCQFNPCAVTCGFPDAKEYGYVYNTTAETVAAGSAVTFASNGALSGNINHTVGTAEIVVTATGVYLVEFYIDCAAENTFTLYQNGAAVAGSTYTGTAENSGKIPDFFDKYIISHFHSKDKKILSNSCQSLSFS